MSLDYFMVIRQSQIYLPEATRHQMEIYWAAIIHSVYFYLVLFS